MELRDLRQALRRFWLLAFVVWALVLGAGIAAVYLPKKHYEATATLLVQPTNIQFGSPGDQVAFVIAAMEEQMKTDVFKRPLFTSVPGAGSSKSSLKTATEPGTGILHVTALSRRAYVAAALANAAAKRLIAHPVSNKVTTSVLGPATVPTRPATPLRVPLLAGSFVLGLIAALFATLAANALRRRVQGAEDIERTFGIEVLAEIPGRRRFPQTSAQLFANPRHQDVTEAYQRLRTMVELTSEGDLSLAVTSSVPGEGKSTVTADLAWTLASVGRDVVAVDCDLRRPALHRYLGVRLEGGVAEIADGADPYSVMQSTDLETLSVISAGTVRRHPAQILHSALPQLMNSLDGRVVLMDTPPLLGVAETTLVASLVSGVLIVIDGRHRHPSELQRVLNELARGGARVVGAVINRARVRHSRYAAAYYLTSPPPPPPRPTEIDRAEETGRAAS